MTLPRRCQVKNSHRTSIRTRHYTSCPALAHKFHPPYSPNVVAPSILTRSSLRHLSELTLPRRCQVKHSHWTSIRTRHNTSGPAHAHNIFILYTLSNVVAPSIHTRSCLRDLVKMTLSRRCQITHSHRHPLGHIRNTPCPAHDHGLT